MISLIKIILLLNSFTFLKPQKIGIVGAGIGGVSLAHYLQKMYTDAEIHIFEKNAFVGGRAYSEEFEDGQIVEIGASFIITQNQLMMQLIQEVKQPIERMDSLEQTFGIFQDGHFTFKSNMFDLVTKAKLLWHYGPINFYVFYSLVQKYMGKFKQIYAAIEETQHVFPFENLEQFLEIIDMEGFDQISARDYFLNKEGIDQKLINELLQSAISEFYTQDLSINAFAGMISAEGLLQDVVKIKGGMQKLVVNVLDAAMKTKKVTSHLNSKVMAIQKGAIRRFELTYQQKQEGEHKTERAEFDVIVQAALWTDDLPHYPKYGDTIQLPKSMQVLNRIKTVHKYLVKGLFSTAFFNVSHIDDIPSAFFAGQKILGKIHSVEVICKQCRSIDAIKEYKVDFIHFSASEELEAQELMQVFSVHEIIKVHFIQEAYPFLEQIIGEELPLIRLQEGLYYLNAMEYLASCTELEVIAAANIANLISKYEGASWKTHSLSQFLQAQSLLQTTEL